MTMKLDLTRAYDAVSDEADWKYGDDKYETATKMVNVALPEIGKALAQVWRDRATTHYDEAERATIMERVTALNVAADISDAVAAEIERLCGVTE